MIDVRVKLVNSYKRQCIAVVITHCLLNEIFFLISKLFQSFQITLNTTEVFLSFACAYKDHIRQYCAKNATYKFWSSYIDMVELLLEFLRATRTSDWEGHLQAVRKMLPWYFAYDRKNYLK